MTTPAPIAIPLIKPTIRKIRLPEELTAASALLPRKFPTISESAVLYNCWNRLPRNSGIANRIIFFEILPSVILVLLSVLIRKNPHFFFVQSKPVIRRFPPGACPAFFSADTHRNSPEMTGLEISFFLLYRTFSGMTSHKFMQNGFDTFQHLLFRA